jgi:hypothetical protein
MNNCQDKNCPYWSETYHCQAVIKCCEFPFHAKAEITSKDIETLLTDGIGCVFLPLIRTFA